MASKLGPRIVTDDLVLALDCADAKSYAGEPTTNFSTNPKFETGTHDSSSGGTWNNWVFGTWYSYNHKIVDVTDAGMIASGFTKALRVTSDGTSNAQHLSNNNWGSNITAGTVFSLSFWGRASASDTTWIYSQWGGTVGYPEFTTEWKYFKFDNITKAASSGSQYPYFRFEYGPPPSGQWFEVTGFQVEAKSYSTPLADTSRSATDGWVDLSSNSNDGTLVNDVVTGTSHYRSGDVILPNSARYLDFDGSDDYINVNHNSAFDTNIFTIEIWFKSTADDNTHDSLITRNGDVYTSSNGWSLGKLRNGLGSTTNALRWLVWGTSTYTDLTGDSTASGNWIQAVGVSDGTNLYLYQNAVQKASGSKPAGNIYPSSYGFKIGANKSGSDLWNGQIAAVKFYSDALSAAEVLQNYNSTKSRFS